MKFNSLKIVIITLSVSVIMVLTVGVSSFAYFIGKEYIVDAYIGEMKNVARLSGKHIQNFFDEQFLLAELTASNPEFAERCIKKDRSLPRSSPSQYQSEIRILRKCFFVHSGREPNGFF